MDIHEFVKKMAEQHSNLLKVIELQNNSIQALNNRANAMAASQLLTFALLLEPSTQVDRGRIAQHLHGMLENPNINNSQYLVNQLRELLAICEDSPPTEEKPKTMPDWFQGVVEGGLNKKEEDDSH